MQRSLPFVELEYQPWGIAASDGSLFVCTGPPPPDEDDTYGETEQERLRRLRWRSSSKNAIAVYDASTLAHRFSFGASHLEGPQYVAATAGRVFVTCPPFPHVSVFTPGGEFVCRIGESFAVAPNSIHSPWKPKAIATAHGRLFVAAGPRVHVFTLDGAPLQTFTPFANPGVPMPDRNQPAVLGGICVGEACYAAERNLDGEKPDAGIVVILLRG